MKKLILLFILTIYSYADYIPDPEIYHQVDRKVIISNVDAYPDSIILGCVYGTGYDNVYRVAENIELYKGYKHNNFTLLAMKSELFNEFKDIIPLAEEYSFPMLARDQETIEKLITIIQAKNVSDFYLVSQNAYYENIYPIATDYYYYEITQANDQNLTLILKKRVIGFSDGSEDEIITY